MCTLTKSVKNVDDVSHLEIGNVYYIVFVKCMYLFISNKTKVAKQKKLFIRHVNNITNTRLM